MDIASAHAMLAGAGVQIDAGLMQEEFTAVEVTYGFQFPPDLREFLSIGVPKSDRWLNWRGGETYIRGRLDWPFDGICFDIEHNDFWLDEWGDRPSDLKAAFEIARRAYQQAPVLIPIFSHRYIPSIPHDSGNPIFSVYQTDIIYYGADLLDYLENDFGSKSGPANHIFPSSPRQIPFWSKLAEM
jgi:hypothetical protein